MRRVQDLPPKLQPIPVDSESTLEYIAHSLKFGIFFDLDFVFCGHLHLLPLAYTISRMRSVPLVVALYGIEAWQPTPRRWVNLLASKPDHFLSISRFTANKFLQWARISKDHISVLPNAVHLERFGLGPKTEKLVERYRLKGKRVLLTLGRLMEEERYKGIDEVMELLPLLRKKISNLVYLIVGDGSDRVRLEKKADALGILDIVCFAGAISEEEKADHYRLADAFVMAGKGEGFGFVFLEAMACGIPVVASRLDGSREAVLNGKLGLIADPRNPDNLLECLFTALGKRKDIPAGLEYFSFENFVLRTHTFLEKFLKKGSDERGRRAA